MKVFPVNGFQDWTVKTDLNLGQIDEVDETLALFEEEDSHRKISLIELFALADARKSQDINSSPTEFVDCMVARDQKFRKVKEETDESYKFDGSDGFFELLSSNVSRHKLRKNGEHLLLAETCMNYEYMGRAKSEEMFDIFDQRIDKIPLSNVESIYEANQGKKAMPEFKAFPKPKASDVGQVAKKARVASPGVGPPPPKIAKISAPFSQPIESARVGLLGEFNLSASMPHSFDAVYQADAAGVPNNVMMKDIEMRRRRMALQTIGQVASAPEEGDPSEGKEAVQRIILENARIIEEMRAKRGEVDKRVAVALAAAPSTAANRNGVQLSIGMSRGPATNASSRQLRESVHARSVIR